MQIINKGNMWHVINKTTQRTVAFRSSFKEAQALVANPKLLTMAQAQYNTTKARA